MKWNEMKNDEKIEFCKRHNLSTHPTEINTSVMEYARENIEWIRENSYYDFSIDWLKEPLIELGEIELWQELERVYNE